MPLNVEFTIGPKAEITLEELRQLCEETKDWNQHSRVTVKHSSGGQREAASSTLSVKKGVNVSPRSGGDQWGR